MKSFVDVLDHVEVNNWCTKLYCTTSGAREYRDYLRGTDALFSMLEDLDTREIEGRPNWAGALIIAFQSICDFDKRNRILEVWLRQVNLSASFADYVLFYLVKPPKGLFSAKPEILDNWKKACVELAIKSKDGSLLESLVYVLGKQVLDNPELMDAILSEHKNYNKLSIAAQAKIPELFGK